MFPIDLLTHSQLEKNRSSSKVNNMNKKLPGIKFLYHLTHYAYFILF